MCCARQKSYLPATYLCEPTFALCINLETFPTNSKISNTFQHFQKMKKSKTKKGIFDPCGSAAAFSRRPFQFWIRFFKSKNRNSQAKPVFATLMSVRGPQAQCTGHYPIAQVMPGAVCLLGRKVRVQFLLYFVEFSWPFRLCQGQGPDGIKTPVAAGLTIA